MEELLKNKTVREKIKMLSPQVRRPFIESLLDLYEQETEEMIDVIEESRMELRGDFLSFSDDTKSLRAESRQLEERRKEGDLKDIGTRNKKKGRDSRMADSRLSYVDEEINKKSIQHYLKKRGKRRQLAGDVSRSQSEDVTLETRPVSVFSTRSTRSLPTPVSSRTVEEEKDEVMKNLSTAHQQSETERRRQMERIAERREQRRQQKQTTEEKALELLERALEIDRRMNEKKEAQDQKLKDRLEDIKQKKEKEKFSLVSETSSARPSSKTRLSSKTRPPSSTGSIQTDNSAKGEYKPTCRSDAGKGLSETSRKRETNDKREEKHRSRSDKHESRSTMKEPDVAKVSGEHVPDYDFTIY